MVQGATKAITGDAVADRGEVMQIGFLRFGDAVLRGQSQVGLEEQAAQNVAEPAVGEIPFVERVDHLVVEVVQFRVQELVIRLERRAQQAAFGFQPTLDGRSRIRQHAAEWSDGPTVADEGLEKTDVLADARSEEHTSEL